MRLSRHAYAFSPTPSCAHLLQLRLPGHARLLAWAWACPCLPHPCARVSATPVAMRLTSSCTQRSPQLWVFSDAGAVNSTKGVSGRQRVCSYLSTMALVGLRVQETRVRVRVVGTRTHISGTGLEQRLQSEDPHPYPLRVRVRDQHGLAKPVPIPNNSHSQTSNAYLFIRIMCFSLT